MTQNGRIALFTGASHQWIADGVWSTVKAEIDQTFPKRITGWLDKDNDEVWFTYPRDSDSGESKGLVIVKLRRPQHGRQNYAAFNGALTYSITAAVRVDKADVTTPIVFTSTSADERMFNVTGDDDDDTAVSASFQTGLKPVNKAEVTRALYVEPFLERSGAYGSATLKIAQSNILDTPGGTLSSGVTVDLTATPVKDVEGFDVRSRFMGVQLSWTSASTVRYLGAIIRGAETD